MNFSKINKKTVEPYGSTVIFSIDTKSPAGNSSRRAILILKI